MTDLSKMDVHELSGRVAPTDGFAEFSEICRRATECEAATKETEKLQEALQLEMRKVITCGVAASHPDAKLTRSMECYAKTWNSPQANAVRKLRDDRDALRALLVDIDKSDLLDHDIGCSLMRGISVGNDCTCGRNALQDRINAATEEPK